jgi:hypothetical protein
MTRTARSAASIKRARTYVIIWVSPDRVAEAGVGGRVGGVSVCRRGLTEQAQAELGQLGGGQRGTLRVGGVARRTLRSRAPALTRPVGPTAGPLWC